MSAADEIKRTLSSCQVAEFYDFSPNRSGYISCPFHKEKTASLKLYDEPGRGWHCFGCGRGGSVIDFVMELFSISYSQAILRLDEDFSLGLTGEKPDVRKAAAIARKRLEAAREQEKQQQEYKTLSRKFRRLWGAYTHQAPLISNEPISEEYAEACRDLEKIEYLLNTFPWR